MQNYLQVLLFDTSVSTQNLGDLIIMDAVKSELSDLFRQTHFMNAATHDVIGQASYRLNKICDFSFVGGTNLLSSNMHNYNQWKINLYDAFFLKDITLMGVGWWQYQNKPNLYTKLLLSKVLSKSLSHSVRDSFTENQLNSIGFNNVINTGCPTMWKLTPEHCSEIPEYKAKSVVFTLTDYYPDVEKDAYLIDCLKNEYETIYFWPQGSGDLNYINKLGKSGFHILCPSLESYDSLLSGDEDIDFVGTRLHAGIRALQNKRRTIILAVDNRAAEIKKDTNLPVIPRVEIEEIQRIISSPLKTDIRLKTDNIAKWKEQFKVKS